MLSGPNRVRSDVLLIGKAKRLKWPIPEQLLKAIPSALTEIIFMRRARDGSGVFSQDQNLPFYYPARVRLRAMQQFAAELQKADVEIEDKSEKAKLSVHQAVSQVQVSRGALVIDENWIVEKLGLPASLDEDTP
jgi:hypothetical protein